LNIFSFNSYSYIRLFVKHIRKHCLILDCGVNSVHIHTQYLKLTPTQRADRNNEPASHKSEPSVKSDEIQISSRVEVFDHQKPTVKIPNNQCFFKFQKFKSEYFFQNSKPSVRVINTSSQVGSRMDVQEQMSKSETIKLRNKLIG
jgi:hypothetical protein